MTQIEIARLLDLLRSLESECEGDAAATEQVQAVIDLVIDMEDSA